jgi:ABC-2 type transport system ATP-binding protein
MKAIEIKNVTVKYGDLKAVDDVSFSVEQGNIYGIIGPNGAGKTSIIECIEGLRKNTSGEILINEKNNLTRSEFYENVGIQLQETKFQDNIKVIELLNLYKSFYSNSSDTDTLLNEFGLIEKKDEFVKKLSGGQKQKIAIILALIGNPKILILDEISTGLDPQSRLQIWNKIIELNNKGITILLTTHFMEEAETLCDKVCMLVNGKIKAEGTLKEMVEQANLKIKITVQMPHGEISKLSKLKAIESSTIEIFEDYANIYLKEANSISKVLTWLCSNVQISDIDIYKPKLEDVFLKLTGEELEVKK